jgi:hypothetical protein
MGKSHWSFRFAVIESLQIKKSLVDKAKIESKKQNGKYCGEDSPDIATLVTLSSLRGKRGLNA